jgi:hypothetical protein
MVNSEDLENQQKGVVAVMWFLGPKNKATPQSIRKQVEVSQSLPMRITAFHFCYNNVEQIPALYSVKVWFDRSTRIRIRAHKGEE